MDVPSIIMISSSFPWPTNTGGRVRIAAIATGLSRDYRVVFVAPQTPNDSRVLPDLLTQNQRIEIHPVLVDPGLTWKVRAATRFAITGTPVHCALYAYPEMRRYVMQLLTEHRFDLIYCHFIYSFEYLPSIVDIPIVLDQQNADSQYWMRKVNASTGMYSLLARRNLRNTIRYENTHFGRLRAHISVSEIDREIVQSTTKIDNSTLFIVAPNGVDLAHYSAQRPHHARSETETLTVGFMGSMDLKINHDSALHLITRIWPRICEALSRAELRLLIVGRNPARSLIALAQADSRIEVTGTVPDVKPWLDQIDIMLLPLLEGAGTKLRVLEAMACSIPILGTEIAMEGLGGIDGRDYYVCINEAALIDRSVALLCDREERQRLGNCGRVHVEQHYGWPAIIDALAVDIKTIIDR